MLSLFFYYFLSSSAVLFYGIGINRTVSIQNNASSLSFSCVKSLSVGAATTALSFLLINWLLINSNLSELFPFFAVIIFLLCSIIIEIFVGIGIKESPSEFAIPLLSVILALNEGISIGHAVVICCTCILSFYILVIIFYSVKERVSFYSSENGLKIYCILLICLAILVIAIYGWNCSWLYTIKNIGAAK